VVLVDLVVVQELEILVVQIATVLQEMIHQ
jgi:hypothetical protein